MEWNSNSWDKYLVSRSFCIIIKSSNTILVHTFLGQQVEVSKQSELLLEESRRRANLWWSPGEEGHRRRARTWSSSRQRPGTQPTAPWSPRSTQDFAQSLSQGKVSCQSKLSNPTNFFCKMETKNNEKTETVSRKNSQEAVKNQSRSRGWRTAPQEPPR